MKTKTSEIDDTEPGLRERVLANVESLSKQQRVVADYLLEHLQEVPFLSIPELARRAGASEATVVRFCQRIGYDGYSDMKMALVDTMREELRGRTTDERPAVIDIDRDVLVATAELERHNIERTVDSIERRTFRRVAASIFKADHVYTFGLGISAYLADFASYLFTEHGLRSNCLATRFTSPKEQLVALRPSDVVITFSFPPYSKQTLDVLSEASERGIPTVVVTDRPTAPGVALADEALIVCTDGMTLTNATASVHVLLNALVVEISSRHRGEAVDALARINRILRERTYIADDE
ncbi:MAG: MurR/RpiR family transcriptional regulator [Woeseiaceae bacterium]|nr:MurR/RpiR family transcriptional regulator [Woeseiaceae bacterium]